MNEHMNVIARLYLVILKQDTWGQEKTGSWEEEPGVGAELRVNLYVPQGVPKPGRRRREGHPAGWSLERNQAPGSPQK